MESHLAECSARSDTATEGFDFQIERWKQFWEIWGAQPNRETVGAGAELARVSRGNGARCRTPSIARWT